jgi:hypothetical protein
MSSNLFTTADRDRVRDRVLAMARDDARVVAGAVLGSLAGGGGDRWSDLDLGFGLARGESAAGILADWTAVFEREFSALHLFDLPYRTSTYRVFLLPGQLQLDVSFTPAEDFGPLGPKFELLFGEAAPRRTMPVPAAREMLGMGVHHAMRARFCIARGKYWQAEHWIHELRDLALTMACQRRGLETAHGRGFDALPPDVRAPMSGSLVRSPDATELLRALGATIEGLVRESGAAGDLARRVEASLRELVTGVWPAG